MLVATTVIEVGVDVPNATVMVILDADRFGIAQLHQLRGRVGRGAARVAVLAGHGRRRATVPSPRVEALVASTDGFELAEVDLDLRGEGTLMSAAQKGRSDLRLASLRRDRELVRLARDAAFEIVDADPRPRRQPRASSTSSPSSSPTRTPSSSPAAESIRVSAPSECLVRGAGARHSMGRRQSSSTASSSRTMSQRSRQSSQR